MTHGDPPSSPSPDGLVDHPDLDTLADLDAGLLDPPAAARIGGHAAACPRCGSALAAFGAVRTDLRALPPPMLPPAVAARLDETLAGLRRERFPAATGARDAGVGSETPPGPGPPVADLRLARQRQAQERDLRDRHARSRRLSMLAAASVVAIAVVGVGTALVQQNRNAGKLSTSAAVPEDQNQGGAGSAGRAADAEPNGDAPAQSPPGAALPSPSRVPGFPLPSYNRDTLIAALPQIQRRSALDGANGTGVTSRAGQMADPALRNACVQSIPDVDSKPVAVEWVLFELQGAYVFVFNDDGDRSVVVVASTCGNGSTAQVLYRSG